MTISIAIRGNQIRIDHHSPFLSKLWLKLKLILPLQFKIKKLERITPALNQHDCACGRVCWQIICW